MRRNIVYASVVAAALAGAPAAQAQLVQVTATVGGVTQVLNFNSLDSALAQLTGPNLAATFPNYVDGTAVQSTVNVNGAPFNVVVPQGTTIPVVQDPATGAAIAFPNNTSTAAVSNVRAFFQGQPNNGVPVSQLPASVQAALPAVVRNAPVLSVTQILQSAVATATSDPVAGNPTALLPSMVAADYLAASAPSGGLLGVNQPRAGGWRFNIGMNVNLATGGDADTQQISSPLRASYYFARTATEVFLDAPISWVSVSSVDLFQGSAGIGVRQRVLSGSGYEWNVTGGARWGIAGSQAYGRGSAAIGGSLSSDLRFALPASYTLAITNTIAYYQTEEVNYGGGAVRYDLQNQFYRNGFTIARPIGQTASGLPLQAGFTFVQTNITGDRSRVNNWQEYGVVVAMGGNLPTRFTATYMDGNNGFQGFRFGFSTAF
jgi:hypothetical protein